MCPASGSPTPLDIRRSQFPTSHSASRGGEYDHGGGAALAWDPSLTAGSLESECGRIDEDVNVR